MIFSELYSAYYTAVGRIIKLMIDGCRDEREFRRVVEERAFGESAISILPALKSGKWQLVRPDLSTVIENDPSVPVSLLEQRWLKAVMLDPRVKLFGVELSLDPDIQPLFTPDDYKIYDKYADGDNFEDEGYIERFRTVLSAIGNKQALVFEIRNRHGELRKISGVPERLEYSEKDDKFRVLLSGHRTRTTVNLGKVVYCRQYYGNWETKWASKEPETEELVLTVFENRNALERVMLHFAHFEKRAERVNDHTYRLYLKYSVEDEAELVIRVLSFGPMVRAEAPESFVEEVKSRLLKQMELNSFKSNTEKRKN